MWSQREWTDFKRQPTETTETVWRTGRMWTCWTGSGERTRGRKRRSRNRNRGGWKRTKAREAIQKEAEEHEKAKGERKELEKAEEKLEKAKAELKEAEEKREKAEEGGNSKQMARAARNEKRADVNVETAREDLNTAREKVKRARRAVEMGLDAIEKAGTAVRACTNSIPSSIQLLCSQQCFAGMGVGQGAAPAAAAATSHDTPCLWCVLLPDVHRTPNLTSIAHLGLFSALLRSSLSAYLHPHLQGLLLLSVSALPHPHTQRTPPLVLISSFPSASFSSPHSSPLSASSTSCSFVSHSSAHLHARLACPTPTRIADLLISHTSCRCHQPLAASHTLTSEHR
eukprot:975394-Rhodomonas_salina.3